MPAIPWLERIVVSNHEPGPSRTAADAARGLDIFRGTFRLTDDGHQAQPGYVQPDLDHVRRVAKIDSFLVGPFREQLLQDCGQVAASQPTGQLIEVIDEPTH